MHISRVVRIAAALVAAIALPLGSAQAQPILARQESGNLLYEGIPQRDAPLAARLAGYRQSRSATFLDWLPDGGMLVSTRFADAEQVHRVTAPLGVREQLTFYTGPVGLARAPQAGANGRFVFLQDEDGDENSQILYYTGPTAIRPLTQGKFQHGAPLWSNDGKRLAFYGNDRDGISNDIYLIEPDTQTPARLIVGGQRDSWFPLDWSPDDRKLLLWKYVSTSESYLYIADVYTGTLTAVDESGHKVGILSARFAPDGRGIYLVSDEDSEFGQLRYVDPVSHQLRKLTENIQWDIELFDVTADGRYIAYVVNEDGRSRLTVLDTQQKLELAPAGLPAGRIVNIRFDHSGKRLAITAQSPQSPRDVYVYDVTRNALERWTRSEPGPLDTAGFVPAELVRYPTWDRVSGKQRMLSAYVYRPRTPGPYPVVIDIHGGPESQYRTEWNPFTQFLVNELGYAVVAPNVRGSSGYGKTFLKLDNGMLREDAVKDIGSLLVWIGLQPVFDRERVVTMGDSYGGFMSLASLAAYGDRLRGGIDIMGISNLVSYLGNTAPYRQELRRAEYGDEREPGMRAYLNRISPLNNASSIRKPLLVVAGLNDPRVPAEESQQMVWRIRSNGGEVWYLAAKDEGQGFRKKANQDAYLATVAQFLQKMAAK